MVEIFHSDTLSTEMPGKILQKAHNLIRVNVAVPGKLDFNL
jgi:hypothetical protein